MRGQAKTVKTLKLTGAVYLLHRDDEEIEKAQMGDVYLYLNDEDELYGLIMNDYNIKGYKGYFKAKVYDGYNWCLLNVLDFFEDRSHQFGKNEICLYRYNLCQERLMEEAGSTIYRSYREHYTTQEPVFAEKYKGRKGNKAK